MTEDDRYRRYVNINLPHARTIVARIGRSLEALGAFGEASNGGAQGLREAFEDRVALFAVTDPRADLDQLVIGERAVELCNERGTEAALARENDRLAVMSKSTEVFLLRIGEHGRRLSPKDA